MTESKNDWIEKQLNVFPQANKGVLSFIGNIIFYFNSLNTDIQIIFTSGYCYYFAKMLEAAFGGSLYINTKYGHIVWKDVNDFYYDAYGVFYDYKEHDMYSVEELGEKKLEKFKHKERGDEQ